MRIDRAEENWDEDRCVDYCEAKTDLAHHADPRTRSFECVRHQHQSHTNAGHEATTFACQRNCLPLVSAILINRQDQQNDEKEHSHEDEADADHAGPGKHFPVHDDARHKA